MHRKKCPPPLNLRSGFNLGSCNPGPSLDFLIIYTDDRERKSYEEPPLLSLSRSLTLSRRRSILILLLKAIHRRMFCSPCRSVSPSLPAGVSLPYRLVVLLLLRLVSPSHTRSPDGEVIIIFVCAPFYSLMAERMCERGNWRRSESCRAPVTSAHVCFSFTRTVDRIRDFVCRGSFLSTNSGGRGSFKATCLSTGLS